jgi:hypothetical protein
MDKYEICHGDEITLVWDYSQWSDGTPSGTDWLNIIAPYGTHAWPTNDVYTDAEITQEAQSGTPFQWSYMSGTSVSTGPVVLNGTLTYRVWEAYSGRFSASFLPNNLYTAAATVDFIVRPWDHPLCLPTPQPPSCVYGIAQSDGSCACSSGFFGSLCQYGCSPLTVLSSFGNDFSSSIDGSPYYQNSANCSWYISPQLLRSTVYGSSSSSVSSLSVSNGGDSDIIPITGMTIIVEQLGVDISDSLRIFDGPLPLAAKKVRNQ